MTDRVGKARLEVRQAEPADARSIAALAKRVYGEFEPYTLGEILGQLNNFPEGCFVAVLDDKLIGYCASMRITGDKALKPHTWDEITGNGFGSRHDPTGDFLYGYEMCVDPEVRGTRIGRRLYEERRRLAERLELKGIVFGGRMPNLKRYWRRVESPEEYLQQVLTGKLHDPVLRFQLANGFEPLGILKKYLPEDLRSRGHAVHMVWRNPFVDQEESAKFRVPRDVESVRIATCQLQTRAVKDFDEFIGQIEYFVDVAADYEADFILFPEMFTLMLLSAEAKELSRLEGIEALSRYTPRIKAAL